MARTRRSPRSAIPFVLDLVMVATLPSCAASPRPHTTQSAPAQQADAEHANATDECRTITTIESLKRVPRKYYNDSTSRSDNAVWEVATLWPPTAPLADAIAAVLAGKRSNGTYAVADMGFDALRASKQIPGGHVWCDISAVLFRGEFAAATARCSWHLARRQSQCIIERYRAAFAQLGMTTTQEEALARIDYPDVLAKFHDARQDALGEALGNEPPPDLNAPPELIDAESHLSDPLAELRVGSVPGRGGPSIPGQPPTGFTAAKTLVDAKAVDTLRRVLRGPNPEGRGFAAVGLSKLNALSKDDLQVVERLKEASPIATQYGCMVTIGSAREFFSNLHSHHYMFEPPGAASSEESN